LLKSITFVVFYVIRRIGTCGLGFILFLAFNPTFLVSSINHSFYLFSSRKIAFVNFSFLHRIVNFVIYL